MLACCRVPRVVAVERPVARVDGELVLLHARLHLDAVCDAVAVRDDQRRPVVRVGLRERLHRLCVVRAHRDLRDVDVAVGGGDHPEILLARSLATGGELGHRAAGCRLRRLAARIGVDLGVQHEQVDVAAGSEHVVEPAETDVVGPAVPADYPNRLHDEVPATASSARDSGVSSSRQRSSSAATRRRCSAMPASVD